MFTFEQPTPREPATYVVFDKVFDTKECESIIALSRSIERFEGAQGSASTKRVSDIHWVPWTPFGNIDGLYKKLAEVVRTANDRFWNFHLSGFSEPLQLTHYDSALGGHYDWHADRGDRGIQVNRKISGTVLLSKDFQGGEFELFDTGMPDKSMSPGDIILFPSFHVHRVKKLLSGERWSLVFWVTGPPWV